MAGKSCWIPLVQRKICLSQWWDHHLRQSSFEHHTPHFKRQISPFGRQKISACFSCSTNICCGRTIYDNWFRVLQIDILLIWFHQDQIKVFSNYGDGLLAWGKEEMVTDYLELSEDPKGDWRRSSKPCYGVTLWCLGELPEVFTVCSSVLVQSVTTNLLFFQLYKVREGF